MKKLNIPVGISDFSKIRDRKYYYIDKTKLISDLLEEETAEVTLITRPRRFGKTMMTVSIVMLVLSFICCVLGTAAGAFSNIMYETF